MLLSLGLGSLPYFALLPACLLPAGRWAAHALSVSCCRCWPLWMSKQGDVIDQLDRVVKLFTHPKTPFVFLFFPIILPCGQILLVKQRQNRLFPPIKGGSQGGEMSPNVALEFSTHFCPIKIDLSGKTVWHLLMNFWDIFWDLPTQWKCQMKQQKSFSSFGILLLVYCSWWFFATFWWMSQAGRSIGSVWWKSHPSWLRCCGGVQGAL